MKIESDSIRKSALEEVKKASDVQGLEKIRIKYLGRKGELALALRSLKDLPIEERRKTGPKLQAFKRELEGLIAEQLTIYHSQLATPSVDLTAPGKRVERGHLHPLTLAEREIRRIFLGMNFSVVEGLEAETEYYNFDALNFPPNHPAREMQDTFWLKQQSEKSLTRRQAGELHSNDPKKKLLLRTQTSPMQIRYMESHTPPFQIIVPGRVFRNEAVDAGHEVNFYQLEGLMVGKSVSLANFKFVVEEFFKKFFAGQRVEFRYRPSYFPFVEPGLEVAFRYKGTWFEVMGAGMVHPRVFEYAHYNPRDWQGFAFGVGIDRLLMIKYNIPDIRLFYSGDLRFIKQF